MPILRALGVRDTGSNPVQPTQYKQQIREDNSLKKERPLNSANRVPRFGRGSRGFESFRGHPAIQLPQSKQQNKGVWSSLAYDICLTYRKPEVQILALPLGKLIATK